MTEENKQTTPPAEATAAPQQESADLTITDLTNLKAVIDLASSRGAFKPNEMLAVGTVYTKLSNFLNNIPKQGA